MSGHMKEKKKDVLVIVIGVIAFLALQISHNIVLKNFSFLNGIIVATQLTICVVLVRRNYKKGYLVSLILLGLSLASSIFGVLMSRKLDPLPGAANAVIDIVIIIIMARQFRARDEQATTDFLTGLSNRRGLYRTLVRKIENEKPFALIYLDLGNFKFINDNYGHAFGDHLLKVVAGQMKDHIGKKDILTRIGGDEFVIIMDEVEGVEERAEKLVEVLCEKKALVVEGSSVELYIDAYAGIVKYPEDSVDYEQLIKYADIAMYQASHEKKERVLKFDSSMEASLMRAMEVEHLVREGLENQYFYMVYQPQYHLEGKRLRGFESLIRMKTPDGSFISPAEFIPAAEKSELIVKIDDYVLHRVMTEFKKDASEHNLVVSINVSAKNFGSKNFPEKVGKILEETGYSAENLEIEITEYCLVQSMDVTIENIKKLREMGIQVALDDFGTGYTSLSYLSKMPINLLKLDKSLIDEIEKDDKSRDFVKAIVGMGHLMGCEVISEGVEEESQLAILKEQQCDLIQGYVWGKPISLEDAKNLSKQ